MGYLKFFKNIFRCVHPCISLISQALQNQLIIPNWGEFTIKICELFNKVLIFCYFIKIY